MFDPQELLAFWFGELDGDADFPTDKQKLWWTGSPEIDAEIRERFGDLVAAALAGELDGWTDTARGRLALVLVLDQLTRSLGRGTPDAFAGDQRAQKLVVDGIERGHDSELRLIERCFLYMPLMHAEDPLLADRCLSQFTTLSAEIAACDADGHPDFLPHATTHAEIVKRFGRYPHRNEILGREPTPEETEFLESGGPSFGQKKR